MVCSQEASVFIMEAGQAVAGQAVSVPEGHLANYLASLHFSGWDCGP